LKHIGINNEKYVKSINVPCKTIEELQSEHSFKSFDCIFMDVEGYEYEILSSMSFELIKPKLIVFESKHLGNKQKELAQFLEHKKYRLCVCGQDTIAIKE
jgi:Methyltransferase FkbM domain